MTQLALYLHLQTGRKPYGNMNHAKAEREKILGGRKEANVYNGDNLG